MLKKLKNLAFLGNTFEVSNLRTFPMLLFYNDTISLHKIKYVYQFLKYTYFLIIFLTFPYY